MEGKTILPSVQEMTITEECHLFTKQKAVAYLDTKLLGSMMWMMIVKFGQ